jgi:hypothetical protein
MTLDNSNCAITLNPTINLITLRRAQQDDPSISKVIQMKTSRTPKLKLAAWTHDRNLVTFWHNYDKLFVRDGLLYRSLETKNTHPDPAIVVPKALETEILIKRYARQSIHLALRGLTNIRSH